MGSMRTRWYLKNARGLFAIVARKPGSDQVTVTWSRNPTEASLLDRELVTHVLWYVTARDDDPEHDVITLERAL